jgi:hypothetical protein
VVVVMDGGGPAALRKYELKFNTCK